MNEEYYEYLEVLNDLLFELSTTKYRHLYKAFHNLTIEQINYIVPKMDKIRGNKDRKIFGLLLSLKRKFFQNKDRYLEVYPLEFLFYDKVKLNCHTLDYLIMYKQDCEKEWRDFLKSKLY